MMKPIRKDEQEYLYNYIRDKFRDKRSALESTREVDVEKQAKKNLKKFVSTLKVDHLIKKANKLRKDYESFKTQKEKIEDEKRRLYSNSIVKIEEHLNKWANIRRWHEKARFSPYTDDSALDSVDKYMNEMLEHETRKAYDNSPKGRAIKELDTQREACENALYSGSSLASVRQYIHSVLTKAQIQDAMPNQLMIESK